MRITTIALLLLAASSSASAVQTTLDRAKPLLPTLARIIHARWPACPMPEVPAAQVEQESSWKQKAELKTSREYGFGLTQITVTSRFNNFIEAQRVTGLGTDWEHRFDPTFQLTYMVLTDKSNFTLSKKFFDLPKDQIAGMCISYNAGPGRLSFRKAAALTVNKAGAKVDIRKWFGGLDSVHSPAEDRILYDTPLWKAVNQYPDNIINKRAPKYKGLIK